MATRLPAWAGLQLALDVVLFMIAVIGFTVALIMDARNQDELAFVLGHETGHIAAHHSDKRQQVTQRDVLLSTERLREVFEAIEDPHWDGSDTAHPLLTTSERYEPMKKITHPGEKIV